MVAAIDHRDEHLLLRQSWESAHEDSRGFTTCPRRHRAHRAEPRRRGARTRHWRTRSRSAAPANIGSFAWNVTGPTTGTARVRVTSNGPVPASGTISIRIATRRRSPSTAPRPAPSCTRRRHRSSGRATCRHGGTVRIELSRDGGATLRDDGGVRPRTPAASADGAGPSASTMLAFASRANGSGDRDRHQHQLHAGRADRHGHRSRGRRHRLSRDDAGDHVVDQPARQLFGLVELSRDGGSTLRDPDDPAPRTRGSFAWIVTGPATTAARVRVQSAVRRRGRDQRHVRDRRAVSWRSPVPRRRRRYTRDAAGDHLVEQLTRAAHGAASS